jgi:hypothetical protein
VDITFIWPSGRSFHHLMPPMPQGTKWDQLKV